MIETGLAVGLILGMIVYRVSARVIRKARDR